MEHDIRGSVGGSGKNQKSDVAVIQFLLNCVPPGQGGANPELVKDGLCGPLTIAAIRHFQQVSFGWADGLVEPGKQTITKLNEKQPVVRPSSLHCVSNRCYHAAPQMILGFAFRPVAFALTEPGLRIPGGGDPANRATVFLPAITLAPRPPLEPLSPREMAMSRVPDADSWIAHAMRVLSNLIENSSDDSLLRRNPGFAVLKRHFHLTTEDIRQPGFFTFKTNTMLIDLRNSYNWMSFVIRNALRETVFINHPAEGDHDNETAFVPTVGLRDGRIRFTPLYLHLGRLHQILTLIHEASHFVSDVVQDYSYRREDPEKYDKLDKNFAIQNADTYAYFAFHCASGSDRILQNSE
jgi:hypothetical protein